MSTEFFRTRMGQKFYEADVPRIAKSLERLAEAMEKQNELTERRIALDEKLCIPPLTPPDNLTDLTDQFKMGKTCNPKKLDIQSQLYRWQARFKPSGVSDKTVEKLYHTMMDRLTSIIPKWDNGEPSNELADAVVLEWAQESTSMETDGPAYRELVDVVANFIENEANANHLGNV